MNRVKKVLLALTGVFAAVPGLAAFLGSRQCPPDQVVLFSVGFEMVGAFVVLVLWFSRKQVIAASEVVVRRRAIGLFAFSAVCLGLYGGLFSYCNIVTGEGERIWLPIGGDARLAEMAKVAGRFNLVSHYGVDEVAQVASSNTSWTILTNALLLLVGILFVAASVGAFGALALRVAQDPDADVAD